LDLRKILTKIVNFDRAVTSTDEAGTDRLSPLVAINCHIYSSVTLIECIQFYILQ